MSRIGLAQSAGNRRAQFTLPELGCIALAAILQMAAVIPRTRVRTTAAGHARITDFDDVTFRQRFRFRSAHVWELLRVLDLLDAWQQPKMLRVGRRTNKSKIWADTALLILLCKLASANGWDDLVAELGVSRTLLSEAFNHMSNYIYDKYASNLKLNDIGTWEPDFEEFAAHVKAKGGLFDNIVCFIDGHFQHVCRPGGGQNVNHSVRQRLLYNRYCLLYTSPSPRDRG
eukprot:3173708-Rhodomonas_salina.1